MVKKEFDPTFSGVQIDWSEDQEIEYLGPAALSGKSSSTAATCTRGNRRIHYLYPVTERLVTPSRLVISYRDNPSTWRKIWGWEVYKGDLIIDFRGEDRVVPEAISFQYHDTGECEELAEGEDWVYVPATQVSQPSLETRGRLVTSRLARPLQQHLRCLLISEFGSCQVSGIETTAALEACHIVPVQNGGTDTTANALLLRRDLHTLFDAGLIQFKLVGNHWVLHCALTVKDKEYRELEGTVLMEAGLPSHPYLQARQALASGS